MKILFGFMTGILLTTTYFLYNSIELEKDKRREFERGLVLGVNYYQKHNEYPSYWIWNKAYENPKANIDSLAFINDSTALIEIKTFKMK